MKKSGRIIRLAILFGFFMLSAVNQVPAAKIYPTEAEKAATRMLSVTLTENRPDVEGIASYVDGKAEEIAALVRQAGVPDVTLESKIYSVFPVTDNGYQVSVSVSYTLTPGDREKLLVEMLDREGYSSTTSQYYFGPCRPRTDRVQ